MIVGVGVGGATRVGAGAGITGDGDGVAVGVGVVPGSKLKVGDGVIAIAVVVASASQNSTISGSRSGSAYISWHLGNVSEPVSSIQITAPSSIVKWVVSSLTWALTCAGRLRIVTGHAGTMIS